MRLLLAVDGSPGAQKALGLVAASLRPSGVSKIEVVTVARHDSGSGHWLEPVSGVTREGAAAISEAGRDRLIAAGFDASCEVLEGHPADQIVQRAAAGTTDLVVLGTRGLSGAHRLLAGSVSSNVARHAPVPVLVADRGEAIARILVGYDGSVASASALRFAAALPLRTETDFTVITAYDVVAPLASGIAPTMVPTVEAAYREDLAGAKRRAEGLASAGAAMLAAVGTRGRPIATHGSPLAGLTRLALEKQADLVVVGDRGRSGIERFLLGSTSAGLVAAPPASVLVVRSPTGVLR